jgi:hypothetical protein
MQSRQAILEDLDHFTDPPPILPRESSLSDKREATAVVLCSDWHVEEPIEETKVNGLNSYNETIADERIVRLTGAIPWLIEMLRERFWIRELVMWLGGDLLSGYIHEELLEENVMSPTEAILWLQIRLTRMIDTVLAHTDVERLYVPCSIGNHGRTTKRARVSTGAENSYEWLLYRWLRRHYEGHDRVAVIAPRSQLIYMNIYDYVLRFTHGDAIRYAGGVGGVTIPLNKAIAAWDLGRRADLTCLGHWHQYLSTSNAVLNGSLCGYSPFAVRIKARFEMPRQAFFLVDARRGKTADFPLWAASRVQL